MKSMVALNLYPSTSEGELTYNISSDSNDRATKEKSVGYIKTWNSRNTPGVNWHIKLKALKKMKLLKNRAKIHKLRNLQNSKLNAIKSMSLFQKK